MNSQNEYGVIFWLHVLFILAIWSSPFWLHWKIIILGIGLYYLQLLIVGDCILSKWQFGYAQRELTFYSFILEKFGINFDRSHIRFVADYVMPWIIFLTAVIYQTAGENFVA